LSGLSDALRGVVDPDRIRDGPFELVEQGKGNRCAPVPVAHRGSFWGLRLTDDDFSRVLAGKKQDEARSFRKLPDYLIFAEPAGKQRKASRAPALLVLSCELKSSETGAASGRRQVQLGRLLAEYLVRVSLFATGAIKEEPYIEYRGVIVSPTYPATTRVKGMSLASRSGEESPYDVESDMLIFRRPADEDLRLDEIFG
jgi:hypothetical protein